MSDNMISKGRHLAVCSGSVQFGLTEKGGEQIVVQFVISDENDPFHGHSISWFGFFTEKTEDRTIEALRILGWEGDDLSELPSLALAGSLGAQCEIVVDHEEYNGDVQAKVRWVNRVGGGSIKLKQPLEGAALANFAARMKSKVRAAGGQTRPATKVAPSRVSNGGGSPSRAIHPNAPGVEDDIPFASASIGDEPSPIAQVLR